MTWQPIETAPRDGIKVDIYVKDGINERYADAYFDKSVNAWCWDVEAIGKRILFLDTPPTHWMPIPEPPKEDQPK